MVQVLDIEAGHLGALPMSRAVRAHDLDLRMSSYRCGAIGRMDVCHGSQNGSRFCRDQRGTVTGVVA